MQKFKYIAVNVNKKKFSGIYLAENVTELRNTLARQGLYLTSAKTMKNQRPSAALSLSGKIPIKELTTFCRQFAIMINAGIPVSESIGNLKNQDYSAFFKQSLSIVHEDLNSGMMLSEALKKQKRAYPEFFTSMIYIGEGSGSLDVVLNNLADYYETDAQIKSKTKSALVYPIVLLVIMIGILAVMTFFVIPTFEEALSELDVKMPALTTAIFNMSHKIADNIVTILIVIASVVAVLVIFGRFKIGRYTYDTLKYKLPIIKNVQRSMVTSRFARAFGLLLSGGTDLMEAMYMIANVLGNKYVEKRFRLAVGEVERGMNLTMALDSYNIFQQMLIQMISVGERTGELDSVLMSSCTFFDQEVENSLKSMTALIQPILLVIMGGAIAIMFLAVYSPILSIMNTLV